MPSSLNPNLKSPQRQRPDVTTLFKGIQQGDRVSLGRALTLVESQRLEDEMLAQELISLCLPGAGRSIRVGITGSPGVGKSTFIESLGESLIQKDHRVAVLAVDPSSQLSGGSILGDKTRMPRLSTQLNAFVRPSPAGENLGGVARRSREAIILCEAAGFDVILIETVGVGQSEIAVHAMVDFFLLLILPGAGDALQGIKRGIVEMADLIAINKADGERLKMAQQTRLDYRAALHLFPPKASGWMPQVKTCAGLANEGVDEIWAAVEEFKTFTTENGYFQQHRSEQAVHWFRNGLRDRLLRDFARHPKVRAQLSRLEEEVRAGRRSSYQAVLQLMDLYQQAS